MAVWFLVVVAGASLALQQILNANLRIEIASPWWAGFISYVGGTLAMVAAILVVREPVLSATNVLRSSWYSWTSGAFGAIYIAVAIFAVPRLGAATVVVLIVLGQLLASITFDHFGLLGVPQHSITPARLAGAALLIASVILVRS